MNILNQPILMPGLDGNGPVAVTPSGEPVSVREAYDALPDKRSQK